MNKEYYLLKDNNDKTLLDNLKTCKCSFTYDLEELLADSEYKVLSNDSGYVIYQYKYNDYDYDYYYLSMVFENKEYILPYVM